MNVKTRAVERLREWNWTNPWIFQFDGEWWHEQPDCSVFGPFNSRREALADCLAQAKHFTPREYLLENRAATTERPNEREIQGH